MVPQDILAVLQRLSVMAGGWAETGVVPPIERDLALEKLRRLYEELLGSEPEASASTAGSRNAAREPEPMNINLDEVLSVELTPEQSAAASESEFEPSARSGNRPDAWTGEEMGNPSSKVDPMGDVPDIVSENAVESVLENMPEPASRTEESVCEEPSEVLSEALQEPVSGETSDVSKKPASPLPKTASESFSDPKNDPVIPLPDTESVSASEPVETKPRSEPRCVVPSLFGPEDAEAMRRHRHKQRILMSLYDTPATESGRKTEPDYPALRAEAGKAAEVGPGDKTEIPPAAESAAEPANTMIQSDAQAEPAGKQVPADAEEELFLEEIEIMPADGDPKATAGDEAEPESGMGGSRDAILAAADPVGSVAEASTSDAEVHDDGAGGSSAKTASFFDEGALSVSDKDAAPGTVLGEVINPHVRTLGDELAGPVCDVGSEIARLDPVTDLRKAIGINDKFLLIRDLFGGDAEAFETEIAVLNAFDDLDECLIHIAEHHVWNPNSDGAKLLMELIERKLS